MTADTKGSDTTGADGTAHAKRIGLPTAAIILLLLTHVWPWWLPAIDRDQDVWMAFAVGQLCFWPLFGGLVGIRLRRPVTCLLAGFGVGFGMLWYCRWQFGFAGYRSDPWRDIEPFVFFGTLGGAALLVVYTFCLRALKRAERKDSDFLIRTTAVSGSRAGLTLATGMALLAGIPWLCLAGRWDLVNLGPTMALVAAVGIIGLGLFGALLGMFVALVRNPPRFSWVRTATLVVAIGGVVIGISAWQLMPLVRHHQACESLAAAGIEVATWDGFWEARLGDKLEQLGISRDEPFWKRWRQAYAPNIMSIRVDGKKVSAEDLAPLADIHDDGLQVYVDNPDSDNQILRELSKVPGIRYLNVEFTASEESLFPMPKYLDAEAFTYIAAIDGLQGLNLFNASFPAEGLNELVGRVDLEILHLHFCDVENQTVNVIGKFENLTSLALTPNQVTDDGLRPLRNLTKLEYLWLELGHLRGDGLVHIARLSRLIKLSLEGCPIRDDALRHLSRLWGLRELNLRNTGITGSGLRYLDRLPLLEPIELEGAALDDAGLMSAAGLPWRVTLNFGETRMLSALGILLMHDERSRLQRLSIDVDLSTVDQEIPFIPPDDERDESGEVVEPYDEWLEEADESDDSDSEDDEILVDAAMEVEHNTIILYQYGLAENLVEAYRQQVLPEPTDEAEELDPDDGMADVPKDEAIEADATAP
jgi:hypothetical protein